MNWLLEGNLRKFGRSGNRWALLLLFFLAASSGRANHIAGGDLQMEHLHGRVYEVALNLFFDEITGANFQKDEDVVLGVFQVRNNNPDLLVKELDTKQVTDSLLPYTVEACANPQHAIAHLVYRSVLVLDPLVYQNGRQYYISWERCCRNSNIVNLKAPELTATTFRLDFWPTAAANSLPQFRLPVGDFACRGREISFNFDVFEADGDSVALSLAKPLSGFTTASDPVAQRPQGGPYPTVDFLPGFSFQEPMNSPEPLRVNAETGQVRFAAPETGIYTFAVKAEEYRNGELVGIVRRDYQFKIVRCQDNLGVSAETLDTNGLAMAPSDTLTLAADAPFCFRVSARDSTLGETLFLRLLGHNLPSDTGIGLPKEQQVDAQQQASFRVCLPECLPAQEAPYFIRYAVEDRNCPRPNGDTASLFFRYQPRANSAPQIRIEGRKSLSLSAGPGEEKTFVLDVAENDSGQRLLGEAISPTGADLEALGLAWRLDTLLSGQASFRQRAVVNCQHLLAASNEALRVGFRLSDGACPRPKSDTAWLTLRLNREDFRGQTERETMNVITPNGDGKNDCFFLQTPLSGDCFNLNFRRVQVFNRWGQQVFQSRDKEFCWQGQGQSAGVYFYRLEFREQAQQGWLHLLRGD